MMRTLFYLSAFAVAVSAASGQTADTPLRFGAVDIHTSAPGAAPFASGPFLGGGRYTIHNASIADLIVRAYTVTPDKILDGPNWLEYDRFEINAAVPPKTSAADAKAMLQTLLADRFGVVIRKEERPLPSYVLTAPKGKQKLKTAEGTGDTGCKPSIDQPRPAEPRSPDAAPGLPSAPMLNIACRNMTMAAFAEQLRAMPLAQQFVGTNPVRDKTGIEGKWDFNLKYSLAAGLLVAAGETITLPEALDRQLGLKLEQETASIPVIVVEKANRPTPNEADVAQKIPAPPKEFEVATLRPFVPNNGGPNMTGFRTMPGGRLEISGLPLKSLVQMAWSLPGNLSILQGNIPMVDAPKWMETDRYNIVAKVPGDDGGQQLNGMDTMSLSVMLKALLADRFKLAAHVEDRPVTAYSLTAPKPKLKKADPASRIKFIDSPIVNSGSSGPSRTIKFQNMSMAQFAAQLTFLASAYFQAPVLDTTGLEGSYDFTLTFSPISPEQLAMVMAKAAQAPGGPGGSGDPVGGVSIFGAVDKQLGLKLVEQKRSVPVLVIDHIEQQPAEN